MCWLNTHKVLNRNCNLEMDILFNDLWSNEVRALPTMSIITPVYNRRKELPRALESVVTQSYRDFEHIVIDDGSLESIDDIIKDYMCRSPFPIAFIKKENGGVHTARNAGIRVSRGKYMVFLDSDDELLPDCLQIYIDAWEGIPKQEYDDYRECNAFCVDQNGQRIGGHLPPGINRLPYLEAKGIAESVKKGEKHACYRSDIMKSNLCPEPEGVTFVREDILWLQLGIKFKTWFLDNEVRIYHTETEVSYMKNKGSRSDQQLVNELFNRMWLVNNGRKYGKTRIEVFYQMIRYSMINHILHWRNAYPVFSWVKEGFDSLWNRFLYYALWFPSFIPAIIYKR